jgi:hypothetical protein
MPRYDELSQSDKSWMLDQMSLYPLNWRGPVSERLRGMNLNENDIAAILSEIPGMIEYPETDPDFDEIGWPSLDQPLWQMDDLNWSWVNPEISEEDQRGKFHRYREQFLRNQNFTDDSIKQLRVDTLRILDRCGNPADWKDNKRGLVFGAIQSGKTASMEGLVCAALDAGYNHIVILTSNIENLRFQTQLRFEESVLSFANNDMPIKLTTVEKDLIDVSRDTPLRRIAKNRFVRNMKDSRSKFSFGIFKKHPSVLDGLVSVMEAYFQGLSGENDSVLVIDDECDFASINTRQRRGTADIEQTRIHRAICRLLQVTPRNTYVGYTATPQASILQDTQSEIFPKDFLWVLEPAASYCGPINFFDTYSEYLLEEVSETDWPINSLSGERIADVQLDELRQRVRDRNPQNSLVSAMIDYILSGSIRWWRSRDHEDEEKRKPYHAFMIHYSYLTSIHEQAEELSRITLDLVQSAFQGIFERDLQIDVSSEIEVMISDRLARFNQKIEGIRDNPGPMMSLERLQSYIEMIIEETSHKKLDSSGRHRVILDYETESLPDKVPSAMIVIGGNILSRGLTIQGLTVSYFVRNSRQPVQDSMLQQNRWYGHKFNYLDLCTVYLQRRTIEILSHMTIADTELREQLVDMIQYGKKPEESLLFLMSHPIFRPTNRTKLGMADLLRAPSFSGHNYQFQEPELKGTFAEDNLYYFENFIENKLGKEHAIQVGGKIQRLGLLWEDVTLDVVSSFLQDELVAKEQPWKIKPNELIEYLREWEMQGDFPQINIGFKYGRDGNEIAERGRKMKAPTMDKNDPDSYDCLFKNLAIGRRYNTDRSVSYFGDWHFDDYRQENTENWFNTRRRRGGGESLTTSRKRGAPILFMFYLLDPMYVNRTPRVLLSSGHQLAGEHALPVFIVSLPPDGPLGDSAWINANQRDNQDITYSGQTGVVDENPMR